MNCPTCGFLNGLDASIELGRASNPSPRVTDDVGRQVRAGEQTALRVDS